jgi:DNA-binding LytR/AlgR family response regulator
LSCLVVDDQTASRDRLAHLLRSDRRVGQVIVAGDAFTALRLARGQRIDAVFLEARLPGVDALELGCTLARLPRSPQLVFVAGASDRAADAFDIGAVDYLLKPARPQRLAESVRRVLARRYGGHATVGADAQAEGAAQETRMAVPIGSGVKLVPQSTIRWVEAKGDYVRLHTGDGAYLVRGSIGSLAGTLAHLGVERIHRSFLVQPRFVEEIRSGPSGTLAVLIDGHDLPVSRRRAPAWQKRRRFSTPEAAFSRTG